MSDLIWSIQTFDRLESTQEFLKSNIKNFEEGACVQALSQSFGYGRHGRLWDSPEGNLYLSFLLKPSCDVQDYGQVALIAGLAVVRALEPYERCRLKWPNDVLIDGCKVCGIIIETVNTALVVGVGLNILEAPLEHGVSLKKHDLKVNDIRDDFLEQFKTLYLSWQHDGFEMIRELWIQHSFDINEPMSVKIGNKIVSGRYQGLDSSGYLLLLCDKTNKVITITSGDVFQNDAACD